MRHLVPTLLLVFGLAAAPTWAQTTTAPPAVYEPVRLQAGVWDAEITFYDPASGQPSGSAKGVQTNVLLMNGHWVTNDMQVFAAQGAEGKPKLQYQGHGVWGWDPVARQYVDTWVDTNDGAVRTDFGFWNPDTRTMHWTALQPDGRGHTVNYRMTEVFESEVKRSMTFYQVALQSGRLVKMAEMSFTKRG
jgi:hypothetical protein